jgi:uncharacterized protein YecE (DUF72 family)
MPMNTDITSDFVYLRFHGLEHGAAHDYTDEQLKPWANALVAAAKRDKPCFVYFNNDLNTRAPLNAKTLMRMVGDLAVEPVESETEVPRRILKQRGAANAPRSKRLRMAKA